jgi:hypothetical protein
MRLTFPPRAASKSANPTRKPGAQNVTEPAPPQSQPVPHARRNHLLQLAAAVLVTAAIALGIAAEYLLRHAEPILRDSVVQALSAQFHSPVQLAELHVSLAKGLEVRGRGLTVLYLAGPTQPDIQQLLAAQNHQPVPPLLRVDSFLFRISLHDLRRLQSHIARIEVQGVELHIPPHSVAGLFRPETPAPTAPRPPHIRFTVGTIACRDLQLFLETATPGKDAIRFDIRRLDLDSFDAARPIHFTAEVLNPHPTGLVQSSGTLGPWQSADPRSTPIQGHYTFTHADLSTIKGLRGTLNAAGDFTGQLGRLTVADTADTPDFALDISAHPEHLHTTLQATVDGTTGDTVLNRIHATLGTSQFDTQGAILRVHMPDNSEGHDIALAVQMPAGRMDDLLRLATRTDPPVLRGLVALQAKLHIPPGKGRVIEKLQLAGNLAIQNVVFSNHKLQDRVDGLSMRAQGNPQAARLAGSDRRAEVASTMAVRFTLAHALLTVPDLRYQVPGATVLLDGVYACDGNLFEFKGHVRTEATASQMVTGWKSKLLKPFDPFLRKNGAGLELPIAISGVNSDVRVGLALHHANETPAAMAADLRARRQTQRPKPTPR